MKKILEGGRKTYELRVKEGGALRGKEERAVSFSSRRNQRGKKFSEGGERNSVP